MDRQTTDITDQDQLTDLLERIKATGQFFGAVAKKRSNGERRLFNGKTFEDSLDDADRQHDLLTVRDMKRDGQYRAVNLRGVEEIRAFGKTFNVRY